MKEIGGYLELEKFNMPMLHEGAVALNCGRNALAYLIKAKKIPKIKIPRFLCDSVRETCEREKVTVSSYSITPDFLPEDIVLDDNEWLYIVNYYGQLNNEIIKQFLLKYDRIIIDNAQAYFQMPITGVDTLYTCRKFFGVSDGAFLYTNTKFLEELEFDESFERMTFVLGRFERNASEFYMQASENNNFFKNESIKKMSKLTDNLLHAVDYNSVMKRRTENFAYLNNAFIKINQLNLTIPDGAFMYPLYIKNGMEVRKRLQEKKIYIPTLWPDVFEHSDAFELEYDYASNILPLPVDQRYDENDMDVIIDTVNSALLQ